MAKLPVISNIPTLVAMEAVSNNVVGYYRFDGDVLDETTNNNDLTADNTYVQGALSAEVIGASIGDPDGATNLTYQANAATELQLNGDMTVMFAFVGQRSFNPTGTDEEIFLFELSDGSGGSARYNLSWRDEGELQAAFSDGSGGVDIIDFAGRLSNGETHVLALRRSGTTLEMYVDGILWDTDTLTASTGNGTGTVFRTGRSDQDHAGQIAGLCVWDVALTAPQVAEAYQLYLRSTPEPIADRSVVAALDIDFEGDGLRFKTLTGNETWTFSNPVLDRVIHVQVTQDATGGRTLTLPGTAVAVNEAGSTPTINDDADEISHLYIHCIDSATPKYLVRILLETPDA